MNMHRPSCVVVTCLVVTQMLGPAVLWAADQRGIRVEANRRVLISAISGEQLMVQNGGESKALHFRDAVSAGDQVTTGDRTVADVLIGNRAVVTLGQSTTAQFAAVSEEQTTVQVKKGTVRVAASALALGEQGKVTVQTPTGQVQTRGGIIRVMVDTPVGSAEYTPLGEARPHLASYSPSTIVAAVSARGEIIQVEEGTAEIPGAGPGGETLTVKTGQAVTLQSGQAGSISGLVNQGGLRTGVVASAGHSSTPKEGVDNLVTLQIDQATALGKALTGAAETGQGDSGKNDESKNAINGATGGVALANAVVAALFGTNNPLLASTGGINVSQSGSGAVDDSSDAIDRLLTSSLIASAKGGIGQLLITNDGTRRSMIQPTTELLRVGGGVSSLYAHEGRAPISTLVVSGYNASHPSEGNVGFISNQSLDLQWAMVNASTRQPLSGVRQTAVVGLVQTPGDVRNVIDNDLFTGIGLGTSALSDFSRVVDGTVYIDPNLNTSGEINSYLDGAITAMSNTIGDRLVTLRGGVVLDRGTIVRIDAATLPTTYTTRYFVSKDGLGDERINARFNYSLLSVVAGDSVGLQYSPAFVKIQDRALAVLDGSSISTVTGNIALLSVLDSRLIGPEASDPSTGANGRAPGEIAPLMELDGSLAGGALGARSSVNVTSAVVVRSTNVPFGTLDGALLSASSPLLAMMHADMTTTSHFADLAGNNGQHALVASLLPGDALVRLNNGSILTIQNGNLLNLNNATASVTGYLFSLNGGSTLSLNNGTLFSLTNGSSLSVTANAFGSFGSGANTLSIANNLCAVACGTLVNSANQPFLLNGTPLRVAGVTQNLVLPSNFTVFALAPNATTPTVNISANAAVFRVDSTSALTVNGTRVR